MIVDFITVVCFIGPLAYYLGFEWFDHEEFVNPRYPKAAQSFPGLGVSGLWLGIFCGYCFQIFAYWLLLKCQNWDRICYEALEKHKEMSRLASQRKFEQYSNLELQHSDTINSDISIRNHRQSGVRTTTRGRNSDSTFSALQSSPRSKGKLRYHSKSSRYLEL